jgi:hypothetical protein
MKRIFLTLSTIAMLGMGSVAAANAIELHVGPGGVYFGPHRHYYDYYRGYDHDRTCRVIVTHHFNRWGNEVTVRRRICD